MQTSNAMPQALRIFTTNSSRAVLRHLIPEFERTGGGKVEVSYDSGNESRARIAKGETADLYISNAGTLDQMAKQDQILNSSRRVFARYGVGLAVLAGAPKPDIGSVEAFRRTLLAARAIAYAEAGTSGIYFSGVTERLGIAAEVKAKARTRPAGLIGGLVVDGEAEIAIQQIPELLAVSGIDVVGPLPSELQSISVKEICVSTASKQKEKAQALLEFLTSAQAAPVFKANGYESGAAA